MGRKSVLLISALASISLSVSAAVEPICDPNIFISLSKKVVPSVVNISTVSTIKSPYGNGHGPVPGGPDDLFRKFFEDFLNRQNGGRGDGGDDEGDGPVLPGPGDKNGAPKAMALGTGFIIDESGLILTNNHVVNGADEIKVNFTEEDEEIATDGEVVGRDTELDLALIKVKTTRKLKAVPLGDSDALEVGEYVMAVGNPFGHGHSVTHGIISAKGRKAPPEMVLANYLQTDASINPGNSGGPLVNLKGEVIGINNAIDQRAQGIGFAIPIRLVKQVLPQLKSKGTVSRGYIGVLVNEMTPELAKKLGVSKDLKGPFVAHMYPGDPAEKGGVQLYDVILEFAGKKIKNPNDLINAVTSVTVGQSAVMKVQRGTEIKDLNIVVAQRPGTPKPINRNAPKEKPKKTKADTGMTLEELTPEIARDLGLSEKTTGVVVSSVAYGGPADQAGVVRGDVILEIDRKPLKDLDGFNSMIEPEKTYMLRVRRQDPQGREVFAVIVLDLKGNKQKK